MKMIRAIIRPEKENEVLSHLEGEGFFAVTKFPVLGCGRQRGIQVGPFTYDELSKLMLMLVVEDQDYERAILAIEKGGHTGNPGDGKIFTQDVRDVFTVQTGSKKL